MLLISSKARVRCYLSVVGKGSGFRYNIGTTSEPLKAAAKKNNILKSDAYGLDVHTVACKFSLKETVKNCRQDTFAFASFLCSGCGVSDIVQPMRPQKGRIMKTSETITSGTSLRDLRKQLPSTEGQKTPSINWFREHLDEIVFSNLCEDGAITVYSNGFYTYTEDRGEHYTILRIDGFDHIQYDFVDGKQSIVDESEYLDSSFLVALFIIGKEQWDKNASKRSDYRHKYYLQNNSLDWGEEVAVPSAEDAYFANEHVIAVDEQIEKAFSSMTQRQRQIARLYYDQGMKQEDIAEYLGVCQQSVLDVVKASEKKIKKIFQKVPVIYPRFSVISERVFFRRSRYTALKAKRILGKRPRRFLIKFRCRRKEMAGARCTLFKEII